VRRLGGNVNGAVLEIVQSRGHRLFQSAVHDLVDLALAVQDAENADGLLGDVIEEYVLSADEARNLRLA
jgi:hypothetical protein